MILKTWNYKLVVYVLCIFIVTQMVSCSPYIRMRKDEEDGRIQNLHISEQMKPHTLPDKQTDMLKSLLISSRPQTNNRSLRFMGHSIKTASTKISTSSKFDQLISNMLNHVKHKRTVIKDHQKEENRKRLFNLVNSLKKPGASDVDVKSNTQRMSKNSDVHSHHRNKRDIPDINLTLNTTLRVLTEELEGEETPVEWTAAGNYSAVWLVWKKYNQEKELARESQVAFMCVVFLLSMLSWAVWCTGMCNVKKITYREWTFQSSHDTLTVPEVMRKRWKYLPDESFYEEVIVHDRGTDP